MPPYGSLPILLDAWWPELTPAGLGSTASEYTSFTYDATTLITYNGAIDTITGFSAAAAPSGSGEATPSNLSITDNVLMVWVTGGVPSRTYLYELVITTESGRSLPVLIGQVCTHVLMGNPVPPPPAPGFGTPVYWTFAYSFDLSNGADSSYIALS